MSIETILLNSHYNINPQNCSSESVVVDNSPGSLPAYGTKLKTVHGRLGGGVTQARGEDENNQLEEGRICALSSYQGWRKGLSDKAIRFSAHRATFRDPNSSSTDLNKYI